MVSICQPSDSGSGGTEYVEFIRCIDVQEPQINEMWYLVSNGINSKIHPTAQVEVGDGTMGQFTTKFLAKNGRRIPIIGQLYINRSFQILGMPNIVRNSGLLFIENLQAPTVPSCWGDADIYNHNWGVSPGVTYSNVAFSWGSTVPARPDYMPRSPENPRAAARRV